MMQLNEFVGCIGIATAIQVNAIGTNGEAVIFSGMVKDFPYFAGRTISNAVTNAEIVSAEVIDGILNINIQSEEISKVI